jgi:hypothetical protein
MTDELGSARQRRNLGRNGGFRGDAALKDVSHAASRSAEAA